MEQIIALDKNYEEKSHKFAQKYLDEHQKKSEEFFGGLPSSSKQALSASAQTTDPTTA